MWNRVGLFILNSVINFIARIIVVLHKLLGVRTVKIDEDMQIYFFTAEDVLWLTWNASRGTLKMYDELLGSHRKYIDENGKMVCVWDVQ